jgi:hypothetical protein
MEAFWGGFEKRAVSNKWILNKLNKGLAGRAGGSLEEIAKRKDWASRVLNRDVLQGSFRDPKGPLYGGKHWQEAHWRAMPRPESGESMLHQISDVNKKTKNNPSAAKKELDETLGWIEHKKNR